MGKCSIQICHELFLESGIYVKIPQWINARLTEKKKKKNESIMNTGYFSSEKYPGYSHKKSQCYS